MATTLMDADHLDSLLCRWHHWRSDEWRLTRGFPKQAVFARQYIGEVHSDESYDAADERRLMRRVDDVIGGLGMLAVQVLRVHAYALVVGCTVISDPRLPTGDELQAMIRQVRVRLWESLLSASVVG